MIKFLKKHTFYIVMGAFLAFCSGIILWYLVMIILMFAK